MSKFTEQVHISINTFSKNIVYYDLEISQKMADHHYFSFVWQYTGKTIIDPADQAAAISRHLGSEVIFTFLVKGIRVMTKGFINQLDSIDLHGSPAGLHVKGVSHTIVLDDNEKSRVFEEKNLKEIGLDVFAEESSGEFYQMDAILPTYTKRFDCKIQYNETNWNFMKRLSARYGQWFYFDGMRMQFGQIKTSKVELINYSSLHNFTIQANLFSHKSSFGGYDYNNALGIRNSEEKTPTGSQDRFTKAVGISQGNIARNNPNIGAYTNNAQNKEEMEQMVKLQTVGKSANSVYYGGTSYLPIGVGQVFTIHNSSVRHDLVAIEVTHISHVNGDYKCKFKAIPSDVGAPHYTDVNAFAAAENQPALVKDNNDPEGMGRVRVEFFWTAGKTRSDWMRVIQQYSGKDGRGIYWRPEIGDEVMVSFEGGNVERPYVSGSHYNGQAKPEFFDPNNDLKGTRTRSGIESLCNDAEGSWKQSTPDGNFLLFDGEGNAVLNIPNNLQINVGQNININAGQNMTADIGRNKIDTIGGNHTETITGSKYISIGIDFMVKVAGSFKEFVKGKIESHTEKERKEIGVKGIDSHSENSIRKHAQKELKNNSGENSSYN